MPLKPLPCRSGLCAGALRKQGLDAVNFSGSMLAWTQEGLPLADGQDPNKSTNKIHVCMKPFALQGDGYEPVFFNAVGKGKMVLGFVGQKLGKLLPWNWNK